MRTARNCTLAFVFGLGASLAAVTGLSCSRHDAHVVSSQANGGGSIGGDVHPAHGEQPDGDEHDHDHHGCSCIGDCAPGSAVTVPAPVVDILFVARSFRPVSHLEFRDPAITPVAFVLPFANAPPATS
jgi:hypothetical protein